MRKLKIYLDTSVIKFLLADDALEYKTVTEEFFNNYMIPSIMKLNLLRIPILNRALFRKTNLTMLCT